MNKLIVGFDKKFEPPPGGFLLIDESDAWLELPGTVAFDVSQHRFNPLRGITPAKARELAAILYAPFPQGENTLTVRNGRRALTHLLMQSRKLDQVRGDEEAEGVIGDVLFSPTVRRVLCGAPNFSFNREHRIVAKLDRAKLGDFDALIIGLCLIGQFQGQVIVPDFGFYGRDFHVSLIRQNRLIAGVSRLSELSPELRDDVLSIKDKRAMGCLFDDAEVLARYAGLHPDSLREDSAWNKFVNDAIA
jgi:hypothetical protein